MSLQTKIAPPGAVELLGDLTPLLQQLGSAGSVPTLTGADGSLPTRHILSLVALQTFLRDYLSRVLGPIELAAIQTAHFHARRNEFRELLALDQKLANEPLLQEFAAASRCVGLGQLERLRPLRDERIVKRYLAAVEQGQANGWHTLVYGLTLAVYSLPLRQGLFGYAYQTTREFIQSAARTLKFSEAESLALFQELAARFPAAVEALLSPPAAG
jgi:urease accessory protein UreF